MKEDEILEHLRALRQDVETQTAINIVEGVNTVETLAALAHWMRMQRPPTPKETRAIERLARERWTGQVRHMVALAKEDAGGLDAVTRRDVVAGPPRRRQRPQDNRRQEEAEGASQGTVMASAPRR